MIELQKTVDELKGKKEMSKGEREHQIKYRKIKFFGMLEKELLSSATFRPISFQLSPH